MEFRVCTTCSKARATGTTCVGCGARLNLAEESRFLGETFGKYRIERVIGAGGMGVVFLATHLTLGRPAALKMIALDDSDPSYGERFLREARVLAGLKHPNVVEIYDFDVSSWGLPYFVMEYLEGCSLRELTQAWPGPMPPDVVGRIVAEVAAGLSFAHRRGVVHRDLKPHNVFVALFDGKPVTKVLDFGLAKVVASPAGATELTATGNVVGTPAYLTPEHLGGRVAAHTDQYALALVVAELLVGTPVRATKSLPEILGEELRKPLDSAFFPMGFEPRIVEVLRRATMPDPAARYPDLDAFVAALGLPGATPESSEMLASHVRRPAVPAPLSAPSPFTMAAFDSTAYGPTTSPTPPIGAPPPPAPGPSTMVASARPRTPWIVATAATVAGGAAIVAMMARRAPSLPARVEVLAESPDAGAPHTTSALLARLSDVAVPPDTDRVLGEHATLMVLGGKRHLYTLGLRSDSALPATIAIDPCAEIVGPAAEGLVWCHDGTRVTLIDPGPAEKLGSRVTSFALPKLERPLTTTLPRVSVSATGLHFAVVQRVSVDVYAVEGGGKPVRRFRMPIAADAEPLVVVSDRVVAIADASGLRAFDVARGTAYALPGFHESHVDALALSPADDRIAVGGWFEDVYVFGLAAGVRDEVVHRGGQTRGLAWIPDAPTLAIAGSRGLSLWRSGDGEVAASAKHEGSFASVSFTGRGLVALRSDVTHVDVFAYRGMPLPPKLDTGDGGAQGEIWALAVGADGTAYVGLSNGNLTAFGPGGLQTRKLHSEGITFLATQGDALASASDDKTIAVWGLPDLRVEWRTRGHDFLVNQLALVGSPPNLYSSSSDGTVKRWKWPELEVVETLATQQLLGKHYSLHALWVSAAEDEVVAGSWNNAVLVLRRSGAGAAHTWAGHAIDVPSFATYQVAELAGLRALAIVGIEPCGLYAYDLEHDTIEDVGCQGADLLAVTANDDGQTATVLGEGVVGRLALERGADGKLAGRLALRVNTEMGEITAASAAKGKGQVVAGADPGVVYVIDTTRR